jgi:hypothetical protein
MTAERTVTVYPTPEQRAEIRRLLDKRLWPPAACDRCEAKSGNFRPFDLAGFMRPEGIFSGSLRLCRTCAEALGLPYDQEARDDC